MNVLRTGKSAARPDHEHSEHAAHKAGNIVPVLSEHSGLQSHRPQLGCAQLFNVEPLVIGRVILYRPPEKHFESPKIRMIKVRGQCLLDVAFKTQVTTWVCQNNYSMIGVPLDTRMYWCYIPHFGGTLPTKSCFGDTKKNIPVKWLVFVNLIVLISVRLG